MQLKVHEGLIRSTEWSIKDTLEYQTYLEVLEVLVGLSEYIKSTLRYIRGTEDNIKNNDVGHHGSVVDTMPCFWKVAG